MLALKIIGIIVLIIFLIMLIPIGADVSFVEGKLAVSAKVCGALMQLIPKKEESPTKAKKEKRPKKEKKPRKEKPAKAAADGAAKPKKKLNFSFDEIVGLLKAVLRGFGKFGKKLKVERFLLHFVAAGKNPADTANLFGSVNAALNALAPICSRRFEVKDLDVWTDVDFISEKMKVDFGIAVTIRIGQIFNMLFTIIFGALAILIKNKIRLRKEKKQASAETVPVETTENNKENISAEERKDTNG